MALQTDFQAKLIGATKYQRKMVEKNMSDNIDARLKSLLENEA